MNDNRNTMIGQAAELQVVKLRFGVGPVSPTDKFTDEQVAAEVSRSQEPIQDEAIVCIDERRSVNGQHEPVRRKTAGGAAMSGFEGAILADWYMLGTLEKDGISAIYTGRANEVFELVAETLVDGRVKLGAHVDNHAAGDKTSCGATDGAPVGNQRLAELGHTTFEPIVAKLMGDDFNNEIYTSIVSQAQKLESTSFFDNWNPALAHTKVKQLEGIIEVLDGDNHNPEADPNNARHNHWAEYIHLNVTTGQSNNRDLANIPGFQIDKEAVDLLAEALGRNDYEQKAIRHGIYAYNVAIAYGLTSDQRVV